jgi:hypothetical protein
MAKIKVDQNRLQSNLKRGEIKFSYEKVDGSIREARGTTLLDLIPPSQHPKDGEKAHKGTAFFDLDNLAWRSISEKTECVDIDSDSLVEIYGSPIIEEEEISFMLFKEGTLGDVWLNRLIEVIMDATPHHATELGHGEFKKLVRVCRRYIEDESYVNALEDRWNKFVTN